MKSVGVTNSNLTSRWSRVKNFIGFGSWLASIGLGDDDLDLGCHCWAAAGRWCSLILWTTRFNWFWTLSSSRCSCSSGFCLATCSDGGVIGCGGVIGLVPWILLGGGGESDSDDDDVGLFLHSRSCILGGDLDDGRERDDCLIKLFLLVCISGQKTGDLGRSLPSGDGLLGGVEVGSCILMI